MEPSRRIFLRTWPLVALAIFLVLALAQSAFAAVSITRAELSGSSLRLEGNAIANRSITVNGTVMGTSDGSGQFRIENNSFTAPPDCTVAVNDGSATATRATLSGCTVTSPPPPPSSGPPAPAPIAPAAGASVTVPFTISWTAVSDPSGIVAYNWQVSATSAFSSLAQQGSVNAPATQDTVGGLANGTYFWRVQAASGGFSQGAWSAPRSFTVTGAGPTSPGTPVLAPLQFGTQYHPMETFPLDWSAVPGASSYVVEVSKSAGFPAPVDVKFDNIPNTHYALTFNSSLQGTWFVRVVAVDANFVRGVPSNSRTFTISFNAPVGPAPTLASPADGATSTLPITLDWNDVPNPQASGYEAQVATSSAFSNVEVQISGQTSSQYTLLSLPAGTHFWRVRSHQGDSSPTTAAVTAWSPVRSFTIPASPPGVASVSLTRSSGFSGEDITGEIQLTTAAPAGGSVVNLTSTQPAATPVPASVTVPGGFAFAQFHFVLGRVTAPVTSTITGTLGSSQATFAFTVNPTSLKALTVSPNSVTGGSPGSGFIDLNGAAPPGGAVVSMSSNSPLARPPATVTVPAGFFGGGFSFDTSAVSADTPVTITATYNGVSFSAPVTLTPGVAPDTLTITPSTTTGSQGADGRVGLASPPGRDVQFTLSSSDTSVATVPASVTIPAFAAAAGFTINTIAPSTRKVVTISASGGGVTKTATLTVDPIAVPPPAPLAAPSLLTPASGARFAPGAATTFDWSDVTGAAGYQFQASSVSTFASTVVDRLVTPSTTSVTFTATGDRFWRVRANDSAGNPGNWSAVRTFRVN